MPGAMSVHLMQFRAITVTWRWGIHHRSSPTCGWKTCWDQRGSSHSLSAAGIASEGTTWKLSLTFFEDYSHFFGLLFLHWHLSPTRKWSSQLLSGRDVIFFWTIESKWVSWCCSFAGAKHVLHVKNDQWTCVCWCRVPKLCDGGDFKHCCELKWDSSMYFLVWYKWWYEIQPNFPRRKISWPSHS